MRQAPKTPAKKVYHPPKLVIYGDLSQMTSAKFAAMGMMDGVGIMKT
jgi:hypothetical protein